MAELNETDAKTINKSETEDDSKNKKRNAGVESEPGNVRLKLPSELGNRVRETLSELKTRGVNTTVEDLLGDHLSSLSETYFMDQVLKRTPEEFYIRAAIQMPDLRDKLVRQARKALNKKMVPKAASESPRRQKKSRVSPADEAQAEVRG